MSRIIQLLTGLYAVFLIDGLLANFYRSTVKPLNPGALGLGGALYLRMQYKCIDCNRYCPQFLQQQRKTGQIGCLVEGGARILGVRILEVRL